MRKYYLDNIRWMIILILFPYHTLLIYSGIGTYYFNTANSIFANAFILTFAPWFMQLLFAVAGIATFYSLRNRDSIAYLKERVSKLLIPTLAGVIFVIPISLYFGFLYNGYTGSFLQNWLDIISNSLYYLGMGLLVGPLWFLLYLFLISIVALPIILKYKNGKWRIPVEKVTIPKLLLLVFPLAVGSYFFNFYPEKSLIQFFLLFMFGYFLLSEDDVQQKLEDKRWPLFISFLVLLIFYVTQSLGSFSSAGNAVVSTVPLYSLIITSFMVQLLTNLILWLAVLGIMGMGKHYLEFNNPTTLYLSTVSFPIYIFHIVWINMFAYYIIGWIPNMMWLQIILIMALSFILTLVTIEILKRIGITRFLFGIKG